MKKPAYFDLFFFNCLNMNSYRFVEATSPSLLFFFIHSLIHSSSNHSSALSTMDSLLMSISGRMISLKFMFMLAPVVVAVVAAAGGGCNGGWGEGRAKGKEKEEEDMPLL